MLHLRLLAVGGKKVKCKKGIFTSAAKAEMNYNFYVSREERTKSIKIHSSYEAL